MKGKYIVVGVLGTIGAVYFGDWVYNYIYSKLDWILGTPKAEFKDLGIVIVQPIIFTSKLPVSATFDRYEGNATYKGILIGSTSMGTFEISKGTPATTDIEIRLSPNIAQLIDQSISDPWEILRIIQNGITEQGKLYLKLSDGKSIAIPFKSKINF